MVRFMSRVHVVAKSIRVDTSITAVRVRVRFDRTDTFTSDPHVSVRSNRVDTFTRVRVDGVKSKITPDLSVIVTP